MKTISLFVLLVLLLFGLQPAVAFAQGSSISLHISQVGVTAYPAITVHLSAWDESSLPLAGLAPENFTLQEDGGETFHPAPLFYKEGRK